MEDNRKLIVVVDDDRTNLSTTRRALMELYNVLTASSGERLFALLEKTRPDLILLDIEMPEMNGYEVIKMLKATESFADIPVIFLSALSDDESEVEGRDLGAVDYIFKPYSRRLLLKHIEMHMLIQDQRRELMRYANNLEEIVAQKTKAVLELQNTILCTVAELVERRDDITGGHIIRTQRYLRLLVELLIENGVYKDELSSWDLDLFVMSSQLHDVGKISIRDEILLKPGKLTPEEFEEMKKHAVSGADIIREIESSTSDRDFLKHAEFLAENHHEKWDGTGYPYGLEKFDIPLQGRLMAIVDVYDALTNVRLYKRAYSHSEAVDIIREGLGAHFDPLIAEVFLKHEDRFERAGVK
ncbi:MAG: response regulator [Oscillospiraceae bacterium]|nr:response regulator [Oscillospiraceae bacterium]